MIELSIISPRSHIFTCVWLITSSPELITTINLTSLSSAPGQQILIGKGHNRSDASSLVDEVYKQNHHVKLVFVKTNEIWIQFSSQLFHGYSGNETIVLFAQNYTGWKGTLLCDILINF